MSKSIAIVYGGFIAEVYDGAELWAHQAFPTIKQASDWLAGF